MSIFLGGLFWFSLLVLLMLTNFFGLSPALEEQIRTIIRYLTWPPILSGFVLFGLNVLIAILVYSLVAYFVIYLWEKRHSRWS